jgi:hypothetical protein
VAETELAGAEEGNPETNEEAAGVMVAAMGEASTGADKPSVENMLIMLLVVTVVVTTSVSVKILGGGEMMSRRPGTMRVRQEQISTKTRVVNSILNDGTVDFLSGIEFGVAEKRRNSYQLRGAVCFV